MPYPSQVDPDQIVATARALIRCEGVDSLSLAKLAGELGIRAPSLYRYFKNKAALLQAVNLLTSREMLEIMAEHRMATGTPPQILVAIARSMRAYAHRETRLYTMAMSAQLGVTRPDEESLLELVLPVQALMAEVSGAQDSLTALRGLLALTHGFAMLELNGQLQRGGDLEQAFLDSVEAYLRGWMGGEARSADLNATDAHQEIPSG